MASSPDGARGPRAELRPRIRVLHGTEIALGPGKVDLLEAIGETGSIAEGARRLGMSYMRAWKLVQTLNACFRQPVLDTTRGGSVHGGAHLTETGQTVLALYRRMESDGRQAMEPAWRELLPHLRE